jgi:dipeptidyl aminopeptidase/acylaminoacyl peptidase
MIKEKPFAVLVPLLLAASFPAAVIAQQHFPSNDDLRQLRAISTPVLSPDGKHVVVVIQDSTAEGGRSHLWLLSADGHAPRQLTYPQGPKDTAGESEPEYLPDGSAILFLSRKDGAGRLFRLPTDGGEPAGVTIQRDEAGKKEDVSIKSYVVAPDGKQVAVIASDPDPASKTADDKEKKDVDWVQHDEHRSRLYFLETQTWKPREVALDGNVEQAAWDQSSSRMLVLTRMRDEDLGPSTESWIVMANDQSAAPERVEELPETVRRVVWMPDGKGLVLLDRCEQDAPSGCVDLYSFRFGDKKARNLSLSLKDATLTEGFLMIPDEHTVLVGVEKGFERTLASFDFNTGASRILTFDQPVVGSFKRCADKKSWVYVGGGSTAAPAVYLTQAFPEAGRRLTQPDMTPDTWKAVPSQSIAWNRNGFTIEGKLYLPPQAQSGKVPLIVEVHGGPTGQFVDSYSPLVNLLLGQGWAVLQTNPRGSTGAGVAFEAANKEDMGNGDYLDIMAGIDKAIQTAPIDPDKLALIGYSYGGEMAGFAEGKTDRFKAIVCGAPVIDQFSEYGTESGSFYDKWFTGQPWLHFQDAWRQSPLAYAAHAKTPFLLLQGEADQTDPPGQSREMYRALRQENVPVQMILFPRENHAALGGNFAGFPSVEPWHGVIARDHMIHFIAAAFAGKVEPNKP